jgi:hypothetical protein
MEPTLHGPGRAAKCQVCCHRWWVNRSTFDPLYPLECPQCGGLAQILEQLRAGQTVPASWLGEMPEPPPIGGLIVFHDPHQPAPEVKRLVGLPGDRIEVRRGDIWRNGRLWQKSIPEALSSAVLVNAWVPGQSGANRAPRNSPDRLRSGWSSAAASGGESGTIWWCYQHARSDRQGVGSALVVGAIRAELVANHAISWPDCDAHDIGMIVQLSGAPGTCRLAIWTPEGPIGVQIAAERLSAGARVCLWWLDDRPLFGVEATNPVQSPAPRDAVMASDEHIAVEAHRSWHLWRWCPSTPTTGPPCAGRWLAEPSLQGLSAPMATGSAFSPTPIAGGDDLLPELRSDRPVGFSWAPRTKSDRASAAPPFDWAWVIRDLHHTGPSGESDYVVTTGGPDGTGLILLGDNPPIAHDSRQRWPGGMPAEWVLGELRVQTSPWESLRLQAESPEPHVGSSARRSQREQ